jgi:Xaa-Pro aminopeptidase
MENVPQKELDQRIENFQSVLVRENLDGAFIMQNVDVYYFTGTIQSSILFIPADGRPILMVLKNIERVESESNVRDIVSINGRSAMLSTLHRYGYHQFDAVGLEMDVLPAYLYRWFVENIGECRWVDITPDLLRLRMIKTSYEIEQIKAGTKILHKGYMEIKEVMQAGMTELEIDAHLSLVARREGHMGLLRMRGWNQEMTYAHVLAGESGSVKTFLDSPHGGTGNTPAMAQGAGFRRLEKNEPVGIDYGVAVNGYHSDQFRTFVIGELNGKLEKAHDCSRKILETIQREAKAGTNISSLFAIAEEEAKTAGLDGFFMGCTEERAGFVGHGIGLEIDEYPIITPRFNGELKEGMVIALEPKFVFPGEGVVGLEDDYVVTSTGLERLTLTAQEVMRI